MTTDRLDRLRKAPAYSLAEAAHYLRLPKATLRAWALGQPYKKDGQAKMFHPVLHIADRDRRLMSFNDLVEAHVLSALRRRFQFSLPSLRQALNYTRKHLGVSRPLLDARFLTDGVQLFVEHYGRLINVIDSPGQYAMRQIMQAHLERIDRDPSNAPIKLFLLTRPDEAQKQPKAVEVDPRVSFGRPVLAGTGIPTAVLADRFNAGDTLEILAEDYKVSRAAIEEAIRCEFDLKAA